MLLKSYWKSTESPVICNQYTTPVRKNTTYDTDKKALV